MKCTCFITDPKYWYVYYGAVEPGSMWERNYDCLIHNAGDDTPIYDRMILEYS